MKVVSPPEVDAFVRERGSRLFVWHDVRRCCSGGVSFLATSSDAAPRDRADFQKVPNEGFDLWFARGARPAPDELYLALKGWRRKRVEAYWNGCVFIV